MNSRVVHEAKKPQTFALRIWERAEGKRYKLRTLSGQRKTFKSLEDVERHLQTLARDDVSKDDVSAKEVELF